MSGNQSVSDDQARAEAKRAAFRKSFTPESIERKKHRARMDALLAKNAAAQKPQSA